MKNFYLFLLSVFIFSFGYGQTLPVDWTGDTGIDVYKASTDPHSGIYCAKVDVNTDDQKICDLSNTTDIPVIPGNTYTVKVWYKTSDHVKARIVIRFNDPDGTVKWGAYTTAGATTWTELSYTPSATVPAGASIAHVSIRFYDQPGFTGTETQYIDDISFESPTGTYLTVFNSDFESWPSDAVEPENGEIIFTEVNARSDSWYSKYVEIYNNSAKTLSLNNVVIEYNDEGASHEMTLSGVMAPGDYRIIARSDNFSITYPSITKDFVFFDLKLNGGYDYIYLKRNTSNGNHITLDNFNTSFLTPQWNNGKLFYRFVYPPDGGGWDLSAHWDEAGTNMNGTPRRGNTLRFTGATNGNWSNGENWDNGDKPSKGASVIIPVVANIPYVSASDPTNPSKCYNLIVENNALLKINPGKYLTVYGDYNADETTARILVRADASTGEQGSLIIKGFATGKVTVQRYIASYSNGNNGWHLISSPVDNMAIAGSTFEPGSEDDFYAWDESQGLWLNYKVPANNITNFENGKGYLVAYKNDNLGIFDGIPNTDDIGFTDLSYTEAPYENNPDAQPGWHIMGNPYASALKWGDWTMTNVMGTAAVYDEASGNFVTISGNDIIPSTNGFYIQVTDPDNVFKIPKSKCVHSDVGNYKGYRSEDFITLKVTNDINSYFDRNVIGFKDDASLGTDVAYDAHKLFGNSQAPQLWTVYDDENFMKNVIPTPDENTELQLNFKAPFNTTFHISTEGLENYDNVNIILEDLFTGNSINLAPGVTYDFTASNDDESNRFILHFYGVTSTDENIANNSSVKIYSSNKDIVVMSADNNLNGNIYVYSILGQQVNDVKVTGVSLSRINTALENGMYIVKYINDNGKVTTQKVILK